MKLSARNVDIRVGGYYLVDVKLIYSTGAVVLVKEVWENSLLLVVDSFGSTTSLHESWLICEASELVRALV